MRARSARPSLVLLLLGACGGSAVVPAVSAPRPSAAASTSASTPATAEPLADSVHVRMGVPRDADPSNDLLLDRGDYVLSYNASRGGANWVAWELDLHWLGAVKRKDQFRADEGLPPALYRVTPKDYARSGFDRGHLCPSADRTGSEEDNAQTFLMTNMQPQLHELNAGPWEDLEEYARGLARAQKDVYLVAGGIFAKEPRTLGHGVAIPEQSFKVLVAVDHGAGPETVGRATTLFAVRMPNAAGVRDKPWRAYVVPVDEVEAATGYDFLTRVPRPLQEELEARAVPPP